MTKLCECGCGQPAPIAKYTRRALGHVKGEPIRFINGHRGRLERLPEEARREDANRGRYDAQKRFAIDGPCENGCGRPAADRHHVDGDTHNNERSNIMLVCRRCHMEIDGRLEATRQTEKRRRGEAHPAARLTTDDVLAIRERRATGAKLAELAADYGIAQSTVSAIANRRLWAHLENRTAATAAALT